MVPPSDGCPVIYENLPKSAIQLCPLELGTGKTYFRHYPVPIDTQPGTGYIIYITALRL